MARSLVQALEGLSFPCDRARIVDYASRNEIAPRAMEFLQKLPEQQFTSMGELFAALPSKASQRKPRLKVVEAEPGPEPEPERQPPQPDMAAQPADQGEGQDQSEDRNDEARKPDAEQAPIGGREPEMQRAENPLRRDWPQPGLASAVTRMDLFELTSQWQQLWLKSAESYTRLFMPWLRR